MSFFLVKLSYSLIGFNYLQDILRFLLSKRAQRSSDTVRVVPEANVLKLSIFVAQRLALHQNRVDFCQLSLGDIRISLATSYDVVRRCTTLCGVAKLGRQRSYWRRRGEYVQRRVCFVNIQS